MDTVPPLPGRWSFASTVMEGCLADPEPRGSAPHPDLGIGEEVILQL